MNIDLFNSFYSPSMEGQIILIHGEDELIKKLGTQMLFQSACNDRECVCSLVESSLSSFSGSNQTNLYGEINRQIKLGGINIKLIDGRLDIALIHAIFKVVEFKNNVYVFSLGDSFSLQQNDQLELVRTEINRIEQKTITTFIFRSKDNFTRFCQSEAEFEFEITEDNGIVVLKALKYGGKPFPAPLNLRAASNWLCPFEVVN